MTSSEDEAELRTRLASCRTAAVGFVVAKQQDLLEALSDLAAHLVEHNGIDEAEGLQREAMHVATALAAATGSALHQYAIATAEHGLGNVALERADLATAEACYQRALAERERIAALVPTPHTRAGVAGSSGALGRLRQRLGRLTAARPCLEQAQRIHTALAIEGNDRDDAGRAADTLLALARLEAEMGNLATAERHARTAVRFRQILVEDRDASSSRARLADAHEALGLLLQQAGRFDEAEQSYQHGVDTYAALAAATDDAFHLQRHARMLQCLGNLAGARDLPAVAEARYREALALLQPLAVRGECLDACADVLVALASTLHDQRRFDAAAQLLRDAEALLRGNDHTAREAMAWVALQLGTLQRDRGEFEAAEAHYRRAIELREQLAAGGDHRSRDLLALCRRGFGEFLERRQRLDEAEAMFAASRAGYQELLQIEALPDVRSSLVTLTAHLADIAAARGQFDAAVSLHRDAIALLEPLLATDAAAEHRGELVERISSLASCMRRAGRLEAAEGEFSRARELARTAATDSIAWQRRLANLEWKSANLARQRGQGELAEARLEAALNLYEQLATAVGDVSSWRSLARLCGEAAMHRSLAHDHAGAARHCQRARELWTALLELSDTPEIRAELAEAIAWQGRVAASADEPELAELRLREALAMAQALVEAVGDDAAQTRLAQRHRDLALFCEDQHRLDAAEAGYLQAHSIYRSLVTANATRKHRESLAGVSQDLGDVARSRGDFATAAIRYQEAIDARAALARDFGDIDSAQDHARARQRFAECLLDQGQAAAALQCADAAIQQLAAHLPQTETTELHGDLARSLCTAATAAAGLARYDDADACYRRAIVAMETVSSAGADRWDRLQFAGVLDEFAAFLQDRGKGEEAAALRRREAMLREQLPE